MTTKEIGLIRQIETLFGNARRMEEVLDTMRVLRVEMRRAADPNRQPTGDEQPHLAAHMLLQLLNRVELAQSDVLLVTELANTAHRFLRRALKFQISAIPSQFPQLWKAEVEKLLKDKQDNNALRFECRCMSVLTDMFLISDTNRKANIQKFTLDMVRELVQGAFNRDGVQLLVALKDLALKAAKLYKDKKEAEWYGQVQVFLELEEYVIVPQGHPNVDSQGVQSSGRIHKEKLRAIQSFLAEAYKQGGSGNWKVLYAGLAALERVILFTYRGEQHRLEDATPITIDAQDMLLARQALGEDAHTQFKKAKDVKEQQLQQVSLLHFAGFNAFNVANNWRVREKVLDVLLRATFVETVGSDRVIKAVATKALADRKLLEKDDRDLIMQYSTLAYQNSVKSYMGKREKNKTRTDLNAWAQESVKQQKQNYDNYLKSPQQQQQSRGQASAKAGAAAVMQQLQHPLEFVNVKSIPELVRPNSPDFRPMNAAPASGGGAAAQPAEDTLYRVLERFAARLAGAEGPRLIVRGLDVENSRSVTLSDYITGYTFSQLAAQRQPIFVHVPHVLEAARHDIPIRILIESRLVTGKDDPECKHKMEDLRATPIVVILDACENVPEAQKIFLQSRNADWNIAWIALVYRRANQNDDELKERDLSKGLYLPAEEWEVARAVAVEENQVAKAMQAASPASPLNVHPVEDTCFTGVARACGCA